MYELVQVSEKCYYINGPAKIGAYVADKGHVYLADSGNDKDAGRKARQILEGNGWYLTAHTKYRCQDISLTWRDFVCRTVWYSLRTVSAAGKRWFCAYDVRKYAGAETCGNNFVRNAAFRRKTDDES